MVDQPTRRDLLRRTVTLAAAGALSTGRSAVVHSQTGGPGEIDSVLRGATQAQDLPGIVALAATDSDLVYEGVFGRRLLPNGPAMTRDSIFRIASMVKLITSVAALQLVEQGRLSLDAPVPAIEPALGEPQLFDGLDAAGIPRLRPAKTPISLRQLLTHTSGFTYRLWDAKAVAYARARERLPPARRAKTPPTPLMFDPGTHWQYGPGIDWVGRIVELISGDPVGVYFRKHILDPLGMKDTAFSISPEQQSREAHGHRREPDGSLKALPAEKQLPGRHFTGGGGIYSTAPDYLALLRALLRGGELDGGRILRPETVALMGRNQIGELDVGVLRTTQPLVSNDVDFFPGITLKWGLGHMLNMQAIPDGRSAGSMTWAGLYNTYYWIDPTRKIAAVFLTQVLPFADHRAVRLYREYERGIYAAL